MNTQLPEQPLLHEHAVALSKNLNQLSAKDQAFAASLLTALKKDRASEKQKAYIITLAKRAVEPKPEAIPLAGPATMMAVTQLFQNAKAHKASPAIKLNGLRLALCGEGSKFAGQVAVTDQGSFGNRTWFGRIDQTGMFHPSFKATPQVCEALKAFADNPAQVAADYGKEHGECCFCAKPLTHPSSLAVGYGPDCAKNYGLPWGAQ